MARPPQRKRRVYTIEGLTGKFSAFGRGRNRTHRVSSIRAASAHSPPCVRAAPERNSPNTVEPLPDMAAMSAPRRTSRCLISPITGCRAMTGCLEVVDEWTGEPCRQQRGRCIFRPAPENVSTPFRVPPRVGVLCGHAECRHHQHYPDTRQDRRADRPLRPGRGRARSRRRESTAHRIRGSPQWRTDRRQAVATSMRGEGRASAAAASLLPPPRPACIGMFFSSVTIDVARLATRVQRRSRAARRPSRQGWCDRSGTPGFLQRISNGPRRVSHFSRSYRSIVCRIV